MTHIVNDQFFQTWDCDLNRRDDAQGLWHKIRENVDINYILPDIHHTVLN